MKMAAFGDAKMEEFTDRPWNAVSENLHEEYSQKTAGVTSEGSTVCQESSSMKLKKEDMMLYGLCPAQDEFFLAICERCKLLVKPQALKTHIAIRHGQAEGHNCMTSLTKDSDHLLKYNSQGQAEPFKSPKDYPETKSQQASTSKCRAQKKCSGRRTNVIRKDSNGPKHILIKNHDNLFTSAYNSASKCSNKADTLLPVLVEKKDEVETMKLTTSILRDKPYVDIARIDSEIMSLMSAMDESNSECIDSSNTLISDENDHLPPTLKPETTFSRDAKSEHLPSSEPHKTSVPNRKVLSGQQVALVDILANKLKSTSSPLLIGNKNGKVPLGNEILQCSELKVMPQSVIQLNVQSLRPLLNKTVISHPSLLGVKKANMFANQTLRPILKQSTLSPGTTLSQKPPSVIQASPLFVQKYPSTSTSTVMTTTPLKVNLASPVQLTISNKSSPGKTSKKKSGNPDYALCKNRQYDPDKHCGVLIAETQKPCTRFLTCKTHPLILRRVVPGRSKAFDELVREQREKRQVLIKSQHSLVKKREHSINNNDSRIDIGSDDANPSKINKNGSALSQHKLSYQKPNQLFLSTTSGDADSLPKLLPDQSPSEDVFSGLLSPSGMLLSPCAANISLFSPDPSGSNYENIVTLKPETLDELDLGFQTTESSMPSLAPFEVKIEDLSQLGETKGIPGVTIPGLDMGFEGSNGLVKMEDFMECKDEDEGDEDDCPSLKNGLEVFDHHPRPIAVNHFNSWLHGSGNYVFTRRGDICRTALMSAIEPDAGTSEPPKKRICLDSIYSKLPSSSGSNHLAQLTEGPISQKPVVQQKLSVTSSKFTSIKNLPLSSPNLNGVQASPSPTITMDVPMQLKKRTEAAVTTTTAPSYQCSSLPPNVTLTRSSMLPALKTSATSLLLAPSNKKQISLTPMNISQLAASVKASNSCIGQTSGTTSADPVPVVNKGSGSHVVHLTLPIGTSGNLARTLFAVAATSNSGTSPAVALNKNHAQQIAISKGATILLHSPPSQLPVLSPSATVILAPSRGVSPNNLFALQNSPDAILQLLPRTAVQNGRMAKKSTPVILTNKGKTGAVDLSNMLGLGLRPPNIFLSTSGASSSHSSSFSSAVGLSSSSKNNGHMQNVILRLPNGITENCKNTLSQDTIIRVPSTSSSSSVMVVTSLPDRPVNPVLLINNKRIALSSAAAGGAVIHPSHQSINLSSVLGNQKQPSHPTSFSSSSNSNLLLWDVSNNNNIAGNSSITTIQQHQRLQRVQLVASQSVGSGNISSNHGKESSTSQLTRLNGITFSASPRGVHHILLGIPQKRTSTFPNGQLVLGDLEDFGNLQAEEEISSQSVFPAPIA